MEQPLKATDEEMEAFKKLAASYSSRYYINPYDWNASKKTFYHFRHKPRKCRFCQKTEPEVSFKNDAHIIPQMIGNRFVLSNQECDNCNEYFAKNCEAEFGKYTHFHRAVTNILRKKGSPIFKTKSKKSRIEFKDGILNIEDHIDDQLIEMADKDNKLEIKTTLEPYIPREVYKCLVKIALSVMSEHELQYFDITRKWLLNDTKQEPEELNLEVGISFIHGSSPFQNIITTLMTRKSPEDGVPYKVFSLTFGNYEYQIILPFCSLDSHLVNHTDISLQISPLFIEFRFNKPFIVTKHVVNFSNPKKQYGDTATMTIGYKSKQKTED